MLNNCIFVIFQGHNLIETIPFFSIKTFALYAYRSVFFKLQYYLFHDHPFDQVSQIPITAVDT